MTMKLYSVRVPRSVEDTEYLIVAKNADAAAEAYVQGIIDDELSVDAGEVAEAGELYVDLVNPAIEGPARTLSWGSTELVARSLAPIEKAKLSLSGIDVWQKHLEDEGIEPGGL